MLSEQTFNFSGQASVTNESHSTRGTYQMGNTEGYHSVNVFVCLHYMFVSCFHGKKKKPLENKRDDTVRRKRKIQEK